MYVKCVYVMHSLERSYHRIMEERFPLLGVITQMLCCRVFTVSSQNRYVQKLFRFLKTQNFQCAALLIIIINIRENSVLIK